MVDPADDHIPGDVRSQREALAEAFSEEMERYELAADFEGDADGMGLARRLADIAREAGERRIPTGPVACCHFCDQPIGDQQSRNQMTRESSLWERRATELLEVSPVVAAPVCAPTCPHELGTT
jgi:hypothetical protein